MHTPLQLRCWEGYEAPDFLEPFTRQTGIEVHAETLLSDADATEQLLRNSTSCDVININNAYVQKVLHEAGLVRSLEGHLVELAESHLLDVFTRFKSWMHASNGRTCIGIGQRFGPFNLVVNTKRVSPALARDQGFSLAEDPGARFGVLRYEDFNIFHIAIAAGLNPFAPMTEAQKISFADKAMEWFSRAQVVSDSHFELNSALLKGEIDFYLSGGVYTVSPARRDGHNHLVAVTPKAGPIDGRGGIAFAEITSVVSTTKQLDEAHKFLSFVLEPQSAVQIAMSETTCNPVAQMGNPKVFSQFRAEALNVIQWETLEEDLERCADYDLVPDHDELLALLRAAASARVG